MKKKIVIGVVLLLFNISLKAQENSLIDSITKIKSANTKDVFYTFLQLAGKNLFGENKTIEINTTLFALKQKFNPDINLEQNFIKEKFARNFAFNFKLNLDSNFRFNAFTGGFTYAFINKRDNQLVKFSNRRDDASKIVTSKATDIQKEIESIVADFLLKNGSNNSLVAQAQRGLDIYHESGILDSMPALLKDKFTLHNLKEKRITFLNQLNEAYNLINKDWFATISFNATAKTSGKIDRGVVELIVLKGFDPELDFRTKVSYYDTLTNSLQRIEVNSLLGVNIPIFQTEYKGNKVNLAEFKIAAEYNRVLKNPLPGENENVFMAVGEFRVRVTNEVWLPFSIKYDLAKSNFFGFLNVTVNTDAFKIKK
jgi:hypothetical protein